MTTVIGSVYIYFSCRLYPCLSSVRTRSDLLHQLQWAIHPTSHPHAPPLSSSLSWERSTPFGPRSPPPIKRVVSSIDDIFSPFCLRQFQKNHSSLVYINPLSISLPAMMTPTRGFCVSSRRPDSPSCHEQGPGWGRREARLSRCARTLYAQLIGDVMSLLYKCA